MTTNRWPYPGARWWKFDFHTHTPASSDTPWHKLDLGLTPEAWLQAYMDAGVDCVAVTDHNSGAWVDQLKEAYARMTLAAAQGLLAGYREIHIYPGVEISVNGGFHLLALFDPSGSTRTISDLLAVVSYAGSDGDSDGVTRKSPTEVVEAILGAGGIPIPAHADLPKGLLAVRSGTQECCADANTVVQVLKTAGLLAVEWVNLQNPLPACAEQLGAKLTRVLGSDCHSFRGGVTPGSRFTWVKMAQPTLDGLRLALLDGNDVSVRRSDQTTFDPFRIPSNCITAVEVRSARFMGNGRAERLELTPYYSALIGGRGTGKSTFVHALRLAFGRDEELDHLDDETDPVRQFNRFRKVPKGRTTEGALRDTTEICVNLLRDGVEHRLRWKAQGQVLAVEERDESGSWRASGSQAVNAERFPIRLLSQGQVAAMAGDSRQALLDVIDSAADLASLHSDLEDAKRKYLAMRARLREVEGRLEGRAEVERKLADVNRKLEALAASRSSDVLKAHEDAQRQWCEVEQSVRQLEAMAERIDQLSKGLVIADWAEGAFDAIADADVLAWRAEADRETVVLRNALAGVGSALRGTTSRLSGDSRIAALRTKTDQARQAFESLEEALAQDGVSDPQAFARLVHEQGQLKSAIAQMDQLALEGATLQADADLQAAAVGAARRAITKARAEFVSGTLSANEHVRIEVVGFGFEPRSIERDIRTLLEIQDERFESDILRLEGDDAVGGIAHELAHAPDKLDDVKERLTGFDANFHGRFRNYLQKMLERPEFADHVRCWFPQDDLRIEYSRKGNGRDWNAISQGSQGQRSAALLAFLLAFGDEPIVLDQPEDDLDNHLIYDLIVTQIRQNKLRRQLVIVTHNPNVVVNGDAELVHVLDFRQGQCRVVQSGALQEREVRDEVCRVMEGGPEAFARRWARLGG
jgi:histidinol phosphatase-like PHP family hydrolase